MIGKVIFYILVSILLANIKVEGGEIPLGGGMAQVQCEQINPGGQRAPHGGPGRCAGSRKRYRVFKPHQESFCGGRGKRVVRASSHNRRIRKYDHYKNETNSKCLLDEEKASEVITKKIGSAPILAHYIKRMGVVSIIDRMVAAHRNRHISHGQMVAGLMVYLLNNGRAMYEMEKWAEDTAILSTIFPGYKPGDWTDDRIADTLDALHKAGLVLLQGAISANIVEEFGIKLADIHYDTTSVSLWGTYDSSTGQPAVLITFGSTIFSVQQPDKQSNL